MRTNFVSTFMCVLSQCVSIMIIDSLLYIASSCYLCTPPHAHALVQVLKKLLFEIENHNALDSNGDAPLHSYVRRRDKESFDCLVTFLTYSKCNINYQNIEGQTALHLACKVSYQPFLSFYVIYLEYNHSNLRFFEVKLVYRIWSLQ